MYRKVWVEDVLSQFRACTGKVHLRSDPFRARNASNLVPGFLGSRHYRQLSGMGIYPSIARICVQIDGEVVVIRDPDALLRRQALAEALTEAGFPTAPATLATKASRGGGPPARWYGRIPLYRWGDALDWAQSRLSEPFRSTSERDARIIEAGRPTSSCLTTTRAHINPPSHDNGAKPATNAASTLSPADGDASGQQSQPFESERRIGISVRADRAWLASRSGWPMGPEKERPATGGGARVSGQCASEQPAPPRDNPDLRSNQPLVIVVEPVGHRGRFRARLDGRVVVASSRTPFCDAARALLAEGIDPATRIVMRHAGSATDALTATVAVAAKLTVEDGDDSPRFRKWRPLLKGPSRWEGAPRIAPNDAAATTLANGAVVAQTCNTVGDLGGDAFADSENADSGSAP
jgi:hypothetical protein